MNGALLLQNVDLLRGLDNNLLNVINVCHSCVCFQIGSNSQSSINSPVHAQVSREPLQSNVLIVKKELWAVVVLCGRKAMMQP